MTRNSDQLLPMSLDYFVTHVPGRSEQPVECLFEVFQSAAANNARFMYLAELAHVDVTAAELGIDQPDHLVKDHPTLRFSQKCHP
jgi:hypothetical protein